MFAIQQLALATYALPATTMSWLVVPQSHVRAEGCGKFSNDIRGLRPEGHT